VADDFPLQLKSTIDKLVADTVAGLLTDFPSLQWAEVDDMAQTDAVFKSSAPALIWQFGMLTPRPRAPMYDFEFLVGAKTTQDPGNYDLITLLSAIREVFKPGADFQVQDFSMDANAAADPASYGFLMVSSNEIEPQKFDRQSGIRYAMVSGKVVSYAA
jgi:hypothetical protein